MSYRILIDISDLDAELERLEHAPGYKTVLALESTLAVQYAGTQQQVHVITRSLKNSGKLESELGRNAWYGEISYGGASPGSVNDPVRYAQAEQDRDGMHNFMTPAIQSDHLYGIVMDSVLRGLD